ncbi:hypothetical protein [Streptomyces sp. UG1]|uniref:hypothetical protein n=1 Tax=Streptomyces sp. UG1 TaxID=3417652 RepID=UPI003CF2DBC8
MGRHLAGAERERGSPAQAGRAVVRGSPGQAGRAVVYAAVAPYRRRGMPAPTVNSGATPTGHTGLGHG